MSAITCRSLEVSYAKQPVLKNIELTVNEGECFGLVGANGAGKSSLIKSILDLIEIENGQCEIFSQATTQVSSRQSLAYLPDRFIPPYYLKARDFLKYMAELHGHEYNNHFVEETLKSLDLDLAALNKSVRQLSKGMTQKLGLAACFMSGKSLYILDEPMSGLDPKARVLVKQQIKNKKHTGTTIFFSSHMLSDVEEIADRMAVLHQGEIRFVGSVAEFKRQFQSDNMEQAYLNCIS